MRIERLHGEARNAAQKQNADAGAVYIESTAARKIEELWRDSQ
jgi:hypothetical protein